MERTRPASTLSQVIFKRRLLAYGALASTLAIFLLNLRWGENGDDSGAFSPMCSPDGSCHESPSIPSPRTVHSAWNREQLDLWWEAHVALNRSAEVYARRTFPADVAKRPLVLLGDSITESWLGTNMGEAEGRCAGVPEVLKKYVSGTSWRPLVLAIGGDQTQHLLWRILHGELRPEYADNKDAVFVVLIGTNNLGRGHLPKPTAEGIEAVARYLLENTKGRIVLLSLLPREDNEKVSRLCPPRCNSKGKPFKSFMPAVEIVNTRLIEFAGDISKTYGRRFGHVDCGAAFQKDTSVEGGTGVNESLMPDSLHPNAMGHQKLLDCIMGCAEHDRCGS